VQGTSRDTSTTQYAWRTDIEWESTAAISRITIKGYATANLLAGSHLQIIGVKEENVVTDIAGNLGTLVNFTDLDDVPTAYANQAGKLVAVKSDESGLEFVAAEGVPIVARYHTDQGQSIPDSLYTIVDFEDVDFDPYGLVTTGANWAFTVPVTGYYLVTALLRFNGASWTVTQQAEMAVWVNNLSASYAALDLRQMNVTGGYIVTLEGSTVIYVAKNDVVNIKVFQSIGAALALVPYPKWNHVSIARIVG
jgi:hypothetical protein